MKVFLLFILGTVLLYSCGSKTASQTVKPKLMWFDAEANFERFSHTDSIDFYLEKIKNIGFTDVVVDIRPITGEVLYNSNFAPRMMEWAGYARPDFDYLGHFIHKANQLGMKVHASLNIFVGGHNFFDRGQVYANHPEWASMVYTPDSGIVSIMTQKQKYSAMINPVNDDFQQHILNVLKEVTTKYPDLDGFILDRVRYDGITADFSDLSKEKFEAYLGTKIERFPQDIYEWKSDSAGQPYYAPGVHFKKWIEWRAKTVYDFMALARQEIKAINPGISFGTYTGAWYPSYFEVGVNWADKQHDPSKEYNWATPEYKNYAYAGLLDLYTTGNYYVDVTKEEYLKNKRRVVNETDSKAAEGLWYCVEGSCEHVREILHGRPCYGGLLADQYYDCPEQLSKAVAMNLKESEGLMVFDIVHIIHKNLWKELEDGIKLGEKQ